MRVYHYTNERSFKSMFSGSIYREKGLLPIKRFIAFGNGRNLPTEAHDGVVEGLLEPEPSSWTSNPEFPDFWRYLMCDICRQDTILLLSIELFESDRAFVVDRAHVERFLYGKMSDKNLAFKAYFDSRVPALAYKGGYSAPQVAIWNSISCDRLKIEWRKSCDEVWERVLANNW